MRNSHSHARIGSVRNHRLDIRCIKTDLLIEYGVIIALQRFPVFHSLIPCFPLRSILTSFDIFESHFIRSNHTTTCSHFNGQITKSKTSFHSQIADGRTCIFHEVTGSSAGSHLRHHVQSDIFRSHSFTQFAIYGNSHCFRS